MASQLDQPADLFANPASDAPPDERAMREDDVHEDAAAAIRAAEIEAVQPGTKMDSTPEASNLQLEEMSIDELRKLAAELDIPDRAQIVEQDELIAAIRQRL